MKRLVVLCLRSSPGSADPNFFAAHLIQRVALLVYLIIDLISAYVKVKRRMFNVMSIINAHWKLIINSLRLTDGTLCIEIKLFGKSK